MLNHITEQTIWSFFPASVELLPTLKQLRQHLAFHILLLAEHDVVQEEKATMCHVQVTGMQVLVPI